MTDRLDHLRRVCPTHGVHLVRIDGKFGPYYACGRYPEACDITGDYSSFDHVFRLSDQPTRDARKLAHAAFDPIWKSGLMGRNAAYRWLGGQLAIANWKRDCHIKHFDRATSLRVVELAEAFLATAAEAKA